MNREQAIAWMARNDRMLVDSDWPEIMYRWHPFLKVVQYRDSSAPRDLWEQCPDAILDDVVFAEPE